MTVQAEILALKDALAPGYGARIADLATRPGAVTAVVTPTSWDYEATMCSPIPLTVTAEIAVLAAQGGQQGVIDLLGHEPAIVGIVIGEGWTPTECRADTVGDLPALIITCSKPTSA